MSQALNRLRRTLSFRKRRPPPETDDSHPPEWDEDEKKITEGSACFRVKYLGNIEVFESRGVTTCEEAIAALRKRRKHRFFRRRTQRAILTVDGYALKLSDETSKNMIVDQTIEKVSFCAPDRSNDRGFAYICRDAVARRWLCYAFMAINDNGARLSHAVGVAFNICLKMKQEREQAASVKVTYNDKHTIFTRTGTFRQSTLEERLIDPQVARTAQPVPLALPGPSGEAATSRSQSPGVASQSSLTRANSLATSRPRPSPSAAFQHASLRLPRLGAPEASPEDALRKQLCLTDAPIEEEEDLASSPVPPRNTPPQPQLPQASPVSRSESRAPPPAPPVSTVAALSDFDPFAAAPIDKKSLTDWQQRRQFSQSARPALAPQISSTPKVAEPMARSEAETATSNGLLSWPNSTCNGFNSATTSAAAVATSAQSSLISAPIMALAATQPDPKLSAFLGGPPIAAPIDDETELLRRKSQQQPTLNGHARSHGPTTKPVFGPTYLPLARLDTLSLDPFDVSWAEQAAAECAKASPGGTGSDQEKPALAPATQPASNPFM